jgi:hypothetical protein
VCWTFRDSLSGLSGSVRVHRDRGSSHNSSYNVQAVVSRQSRQRQLLYSTLWSSDSWWTHTVDTEAEESSG